MANIVFDTYGKTRVRLTYVDRQPARHELKELSVDILLEGAFDEAFTKADNSIVLPTDTMKNTVYALARRKPLNCIEEFARDLGRHFLAVVPHLTQAKIEITETPWSRIEQSPAAFVQTGNERRTVRLTASHSGETVLSGIHDLQILKTAHSAFTGFIKDEFTTLSETTDRLFGTVMKADWLYAAADIEFDKTRGAIRALLLNTFAAHHSLSVQQTVFDMAQAVLVAVPLVKEIHLTMPNKHCLLVDLSRFGMDNPNQIFQPIDEPSGYIEARVIR